jgi:AraC-like DNA-binding protein
MPGIADLSPAMRMEAFKPSPALAAHITDLWDYEIPRSARAGMPDSLTLLPDGCPTMVFVYGAPLRASDGERVFTTRSAVCGFQMRPVRVSCDGDVAGITVRFTPAGLAGFVPGSLECAALRRVECRDVFGQRAIEDLECALAELPTALARVRRVEAYLLALLRAKADPLVEKVVHDMAHGSAGPRPMRDLAADCGFSDRTLERRFRQAIGTSPKTFSRVLRLQQVLRSRQARGAAWSELALDAGYYDQAHLIRDARSLFGATPKALSAPLGDSMASRFRKLSQAADLPSMIFR